MKSSHYFSFFNLCKVYFICVLLCSCHLHHNTNNAFYVFLFKTQILLLVILESKRPQETPRVNRVFRQQWRPSNWFCWRLLSARWGCTCLVAQPSPTLCIPMDCSPLDSSVHGISQARILEWVAISSSRGSSPPTDRTWIFCVS